MLGLEVIGVLFLILIGLFLLLFFKVLKGVVEFIAIGLIVIVLVSFVLVSLVYSDVTQMYTKGLNKTNTFAVFTKNPGTDIEANGKDSDAMTIDYVFKSEKDDSIGTGIKLSIDDSKQKRFAQKTISESDFASLRGDSYRLVLVDKSIIDKYSSGSLQASASTDNSAASIATIYWNEILKAQMQDPKLLIKEYKEGKIRVYPETITFKMIKILPGVFDPMIDSALKKFQET